MYLYVLLPKWLKWLDFSFAIIVRGLLFWPWKKHFFFNLFTHDEVLVITFTQQDTKKQKYHLQATYRALSLLSRDSNATENDFHDCGKYVIITQKLVFFVKRRSPLSCWWFDVKRTIYWRFISGEITSHSLGFREQAAFPPFKDSYNSTLPAITARLCSEFLQLCGGTFTFVLQIC